MKAEVIRVFFDDNGLHKVGEIIEVAKINEALMKPIKEAEKPKRTTKK